jgi:hypothetical protein
LQTPSPETESDIIVAPDPQTEKFYEGAYSRIGRSMAVLAILACAYSLARYGWHVAAGLAVGCGLSAVNFLWMKRAINSFAARMAGKGENEKVSRGSATRFVARYGLMGVAAYVIFKSSIVSLNGVLIGLFLPVAAILVEAVYETYVALRHG